MKFFAILTVFAVSCKVHPNSDGNNLNADKILKIQVKPVPGFSYNYHIINETSSSMEFNDKKNETSSKSDMEANYSMNRDSSGNYVVSIKYNKLHIYSKKNDDETNLDADNAATSSDPTERILGALRNVPIRVTVNKAGEVIKTEGYQEIANQFLSQIASSDVNSKVMAQKLWKQLVEQSLVKTNMQQLFTIFPDSSVRIGDHWKLFSKEGGDMGFKIGKFYKLESITDGIANVTSHGNISTDSASNNIMGYQINSDLKGDQSGEYEINIKTGMMENSKVETNIAGTIKVMGQEVPIKIKTTQKIEGKKL